MILHDLTVKVARIDILKGIATLSFEADLSQEILDNRFRLAYYAENDEKVTLEIDGLQMSLIPEPANEIKLAIELLDELIAAAPPEPEPEIDPEHTGTGNTLEDDLGDILGGKGFAESDAGE